MLKKIASHVKRISYHLGNHTTIGNQSFRRQGYYASQMDYSKTRHEAYMVDVFRRRLDSSPGTFIDIGVNVGQTLIKILEIDPNRVYIGFEPQIACSYNVEQFLRLNDLKNAEVLPIALSDSNNIVKFYSQGQFDEMASLKTKVAGAEIMPSVSHVQARIGDEVLRELEIGEICAIKIDVEGAELQVLRGLQETLRTKSPPIIFEVLPNFSGVIERKMHSSADCSKNQAFADAIYDLFTNAGYDIFQIDYKGGETKISRFELDDMAAFAGSNYIAYPDTSV